MNNPKTAALLLHLSVFLSGMPGVIAKLIALPPHLIVFGRTSVAAAALFLFMRMAGRLITLPLGRERLMLAIQGGALALHWVFFFQSVQVASVAIAVITSAACPLFVALAEPFFFKERFSYSDVLFALLVLFGIYLLSPNPEFNDRTTQGVFWGLAAAALFAAITLLNRRFMLANQDALTVSFAQNACAALVLLPFSLSLFESATAKDALLITILGVFFTALAFALLVAALKRLRAATVNITLSLSALYGILFAYLLLGETPTLQIAGGGACILAAAALSNVRGLREKQAD